MTPVTPPPVPRIELDLMLRAAETYFVTVIRCALATGFEEQAQQWTEVDKAREALLNTLETISRG